MIKAVLFDFDGTLVNNMKYHYKAYKKVLTKLGIKLKPNDIYLIEGKRGEEIVSLILKKSGIKANIEEIVKEKRKLYNQIAKDLKINQEARELIINLKSIGIKTGIVTGGKRKNVIKTLGNDKSLFDIMICGDDVKNSKPDPEPYIKCCKKLNLSPSECIVIENAPLGILSAKRAGMTCISITTTLSKKHLQNADFIVKDFNEIREILKKQIKF